MYFFANFINIFFQLLKNYYIMHIIKETLNFNFMKKESYFCFEITKIKEWNAIFSIWFFNLHRLCVSFSILCVIYVSIVFPSSMGKIVLFWDTYHNIKLICFFLNHQFHWASRPFKLYGCATSASRSDRRSAC